MTEEKNVLTDECLEGETIKNQETESSEQINQIEDNNSKTTDSSTDDLEQEIENEGQNEKIEEISIEAQKEQEKKEILSRISPGMVVKVYQKIIETDPKGNPKERVQVFEGMVIARKGGFEAGATFMVRKMAAGHVGVEKIFPIDLPTILKVEILKEHKIRRSKLYFLRNFRRKLKEIKKK